MKRLLIFILGFYSSIVFAFQDNFETVSLPTASEAEMEQKIFANMPYSLCDLDSPSLTKSQCDLISIRLGGPIYRKYIWDPQRESQTESYFDDLSYSALSSIPQDYLFHDDPMQIPTRGQLETLYQTGILRPNTGDVFWASDPSGNWVQYIFGGHTTSKSTAALPRIVSPSLSETAGNNFNVKSLVYLYATNTSSKHIWFDYFYHKRGDMAAYVGDAFNLKSGVGTFAYPAEAWDYYVRVCDNMQRCSEYVEFQKPGFADNGWCFIALGAYFATPYLRPQAEVSSAQECLDMHY